MCSVSFLPREQGYDLAMNRDESRTRAAAFPPMRAQDGLRSLLFPSETGGGTWIGVNDLGHTFALVNWYARPLRVLEMPLSRGLVVRRLLSSDSPEEVRSRLEKGNLERVQPFRLITVWNGVKTVKEWCWDGATLETLTWPWERRHWFSSGHDEPGAQVSRQGVSEAVSNLDSIHQVRALHSSHAPECGPYSICMHRAEAVTVSYTEVRVRPEGCSLYYLGKAPCEAVPGDGVEITLQPAGGA